MRTLKAGILASLLVLTVVPASAGPYRVNLAQTRYAKYNLRLTYGTATLTITRSEGAQTWGNFSTATVSSNQRDQGVSWKGCVTVKAGGLTDTACEILDPAKLDIDPALSTGYLTVSLMSKKYAGRIITVNLKLFGTGNPSPTYSAVPTPNGKRITEVANALVSRSATAVGSVKSEVVGGGGVRSVTSGAIGSGVAEYGTFDANKMLCLHNTQDPQNPTCFD